MLSEGSAETSGHVQQRRQSAITNPSPIQAFSRLQPLRHVNSSWPTVLVAALAPDF